MTQMVVDIGAMRKALTEVTDAHKEASTTLRMAESLSSSLPAVWRGGAADQFRATVANWCTQYRRVVNALDALRESLQRATSTLESVEQAAMARSKK